MIRDDVKDGENLSGDQFWGRALTVPRSMQARKKLDVISYPEMRSARSSQCAGPNSTWTSNQAARTYVRVCHLSSCDPGIPHGIGMN
jgi:hypothetical protein